MIAILEFGHFTPHCLFVPSILQKKINLWSETETIASWWDLPNESEEKASSPSTSTY
jgi:hypothetical protein